MHASSSGSNLCITPSLLYHEDMGLRAMRQLGPVDHAATPQQITSISGMHWFEVAPALIHLDGVSKNAGVACGNPVSKEAADVLPEVLAVLDVLGVIEDKRSLTLVAVWVDADDSCHHSSEQASHHHDGGDHGVHLDRHELGQNRPGSHCA